MTAKPACALATALTTGRFLCSPFFAESAPYLCLNHDKVRPPEISLADFPLIFQQLSIILISF